MWVHRADRVGNRNEPRDGVRQRSGLGAALGEDSELFVVDHDVGQRLVRVEAIVAVVTGGAVVFGGWSAQWSMPSRVR